MAKFLLGMLLAGFGLWMLGGYTGAGWNFRGVSNIPPATTCTVGDWYIDILETDDTGGCVTVLDNAICVCVITNTWAGQN